MKPFCTIADEYYDFSFIQKAFKHAGFDVDYKEVGWGYSEITQYPFGGQYHAVFYLIEDKDSEETLKLINYYKEMLAIET